MASELETNTSTITPELEHQRKVEMNVSSSDKSKQTELQESILSPEIKQNTLNYWAGVNVMGGVVNPMLVASKEDVLEMARRDMHEVTNALDSAGINYQDNPMGTVEALFKDKTTKEKDIRSIERETIDKIGAKRVRMHFDEVLTHLSTVEGLFDDSGNIKESEKNSDLYTGFTQLVEYVKDLEKSGVKVEIALGPGVKHPDRTADKRHVYSVTEYELPSEKEDTKVWERYCKGIARNFPNSDLTVWVEPNFDEFVKGGRDPNKYAEAVRTAANAIQEIDSKRKVGMSMLFLDQGFALDTLKQIKESGSKPNDLVEYVTFNPYRFRAPEAPTWTESARKMIYREKPVDTLSSELPDTYENEVMSFYKRLSEYGINDIRVGESGYQGDGYSVKQNAICNVRSWVLDRYLWVRETPWRAIQKEDSDKKYGLVSEKGIPTENFNAYKHFNEIFTPDVVPVGEITDPDDRRVYSKVFKNNHTGGDIVVLWTAQTYEPSEEIYKRTFVLDVPEKSNFKQVSCLWKDKVEEQSVTGASLSKEGVEVGDDPIILVGNFG